MKPVRENLVGNPFAKPSGRSPGGVIHRQLPAGRVLLIAVAIGPQILGRASLPPKAEVVPDQLRLRRSLKGNGKEAPVLLIAGKNQRQFLPAVGKLDRKSVV